MDWEPHLASTPAGHNAPSGIFQKHKQQQQQQLHTGFSSSAAAASPFLFHSASMQVDRAPVPMPSTSFDERQPVASTSSSAGTGTDAAQERDIAHGAVQRERRKREQKKDWQLVANKTPELAHDEGAGGLEGQEDDGQEDDGGGESEHDASFIDSLSFSAPIKGLIRRAKSGRRRGNHTPLHLSLHNHTYHWPANTQEPFVFGHSAQAMSPTGQHTPHATAPMPSGWWHSDMPYVLLGYLQFTFNASLVLLSLYLLLSFFLLLKNDVSERISEYSIEAQQEIMHCSSNYISNRCNPGERVPAMEAQCKAWEYCMNKDPKVVNKLRVAAEIVAEVVNGFVEIISWRTMLFLLATLFIVVAYTNRTITSYRRHHSVLQAEEHNQYIQKTTSTKERPKSLSYSSAPPAVAS